MTAASPLYTSQNFESMRLRLASLLRSNFPTWTDHQTANFGNVLADAFAFCGDIVSVTQNQQAGESRITTATQRRSLLALSKLLNYTPQLTGAATCDVTLSAPGITANVEVPPGTTLKTLSNESPVEFQTVEPVILTPSSPSASGTVENSKTQTTSFSGTGQAGQTLLLSEGPFLGLVSVKGASSGPWEQVESFLLTGPSDKPYVAAVDNNDLCTITFPSGTNGRMPSDILTILYKTGGGSSGNVAAGSIVKVVDSLVDMTGAPVNVSCINTSPAVGGADRETTASIRQRAPLSIRNPSSAIARTDFEDHAVTSIPGITRALMLTVNQDPSIPYNAGRLYVVPTGNAETPPSPGFATDLQIDAVKALFVSESARTRALFPAPLTFDLTVLPATYLDVSVSAKIFFTRPEASVAADPAKLAARIAGIKAAITTALEAFFNPLLADGTTNPLINFGYYLRQDEADTGAAFGQLALSDIMNAVRDVAGVRKLGPLPADFTLTADAVTASTSVSVVSGQHVDIDLQDKWFPRFNTVTLVDGDTGLTI